MSIEIDALAAQQGTRTVVRSAKPGFEAVYFALLRDFQKGESASAAVVSAMTKTPFTEVRQRLGNFDREVNSTIRNTHYIASRRNWCKAIVGLQGLGIEPAAVAETLGYASEDALYAAMPQE